MIDLVYKASLFSKDCDEIDFSATAIRALPMALSAIALAGAVGCVEPIIGVVVILTGLVVTTAYVIFFATLVDDDNSSVGETSNSSDKEEEVEEAINWDEITGIIGDAPTLEVSTLENLKLKDVPYSLMQGVFEGAPFIVIKLKIEGYRYQQGVDSIIRSDKIVGSAVMEVVKQGEDGPVVYSETFPQFLGVSEEMRICSHPSLGDLREKLRRLVTNRETLEIQAGGLVYDVRLNSDSS